MAESKYKSLVRRGKWNTPSKEQKEILALAAQLETMSKKQKVRKNEEVNKKYKSKKVVPKDLKDTKQKNGKSTGAISIKCGLYTKQKIAG